MVSDLILKHRNKLTKMLYMSKTSVFTDMFTIREIYLVRTLPLLSIEILIRQRG
jgi:hypothetical protein